MAIGHSPILSLWARWAPWGLVGLACVAFVGLMGAERAVLRGSRGPESQPTEAPGSAPAAPASATAELNLPPATGTQAQVLQGLEQQLAQASSPADRRSLLDRLSAAAVGMQRYDLAARYQEQLYGLTQAASAQRQAAFFYAEAAERLVRMNDTVLAPGLTARARNLLMAYQQQQPQDLDAQVLGHVLTVQGEDPNLVMASVRGLAALAEQHPELVRAHVALGRFSLVTQQLDKAQSRLQAALARAPQDIEALYLMGMVAAAKGQRAEARSWLLKARNQTQQADWLQLIDGQLALIP